MISRSIAQAANIVAAFSKETRSGELKQASRGRLFRPLNFAVFASRDAILKNVQPKAPPLPPHLVRSHGVERRVIPTFT